MWSHARVDASSTTAASKRAFHKTPNQTKAPTPTNCLQTDKFLVVCENVSRADGFLFFPLS